MQPDAARDVEKDQAYGRPPSAVHSDGNSTASGPWAKLVRKGVVEARGRKDFMPWSLEGFLMTCTVGIAPVPIGQRTDTRFYQIFFIWFSWNFNILS
jgi:hypothetical protein